MVSVVDPRPSSFMRLELLSSMTVGAAAPTRTPADCCDRYFPKGTELSVYRAESRCRELFGKPGALRNGEPFRDWTCSPCCARYASASPHTLTGTGVGPPPTAWAMPASPGRVRVRRLARECMAVRELPRGFFLAESRKGVLIGGTGSGELGARARGKGAVHRHGRPRQPARGRSARGKTGRLATQLARTNLVILDELG